MIERLRELDTLLSTSKGMRAIGITAAVVLITSVASLGAVSPKDEATDLAGASDAQATARPSDEPSATSEPTATSDGGVSGGPVTDRTSVGGGTSKPAKLKPGVKLPDFGLKTQGVNAKQVEVGISYNVSGCGDAAAIAGMFGPSVTGDPKKAIDTFARYINETGGIGGRRYKPVIVDDGGTCPEKNLAAAIKMADEEKVFLAAPGLHVESDYIINRSHIPVWGGRDDPDSLRKYGANGLQVLEPIEPTLDAWAAFGKHYLKSHNTTNPPCLVRIESGASGNWDIPQKLLIGKLAKNGLKFRDIIVFKDDVSTAQQQSSTGAVRLRDKGCKQVWFMAGNPIGLVFFTSAATQNGFFPTWTWTSYTAGVDTELAGNLMDQAQWENAVGLTIRVPPGQHKKENNCKNIYEKYNPGDGQSGSASVLVYCPTILNTAEIMRRAIARTGVLTANSFMLGADLIRDDFFYDSTVPMSFRFPSAKGPFKTRGFSHWTVADWSAAQRAYTFPKYPCYYRTFKAGGGGCEDLRPTYKK